jgi:hypothetical protein
MAVDVGVSVFELELAWTVAFFGLSGFWDAAAHVRGGDAGRRHTPLTTGLTENYVSTLHCGDHPATGDWCLIARLAPRRSSARTVGPVRSATRH